MPAVVQRLMGYKCCYQVFHRFESFYSYRQHRSSKWRQIFIGHRNQNFPSLRFRFRIELICCLFDCSLQDVRVYSEEVELDGKDAEQDYQQFKESCDSLAKLMSEIQELKANGAKEGVRARPLTCTGLELLK